jgi:hypothetical protein
MTTSEFLSRALKSQAQGFSRASDLLPILNDLHSMLYKHEDPFTMYIDPTTGKPPVLNTTNGVLVYSGRSDCWRVSRICTTYPVGTDYGYQLIDNTLSPPYTNTSEHVEVNGNFYYPYNFADTRDAVGSAAPVITFSRNPQATTAKFYQITYKNPVQITSDRIQLQIPDSDGAHRFLVFPCFMKLIEAQNNGNYEEAIEYIENMKLRLWKVLSGGEHGKQHRTMPRPY